MNPLVSTAPLSAALLLLWQPLACGLEIELRYDLDTSGFFEQPGAKEAMRAAADLYEDLIVDELGAIDASQFPAGSSWAPTYFEPNAGNAIRSIPGANNLVVPENTIIIFLGERNLPTTAQGGPGGFNPGSTFSPGFPWYNQFLNRGVEGATRLLNNATFSTNPTDFAPWGGTIFFDTGRTWNFSTSSSTASSGIDFISVALHEICHILGFGNLSPATSSWLPLLGSDQCFHGPLATLSHGTPPRSGDQTHWGSTSNSMTAAVFGRTHGESQPPLMLSSAEVLTTTDSSLLVITDLEIAALQDIGWEVDPKALNFDIALDLQSDNPQIDIPTATGMNYTVRRSTTLGDLTPAGDMIPGNGGMMTWTDPNPRATRAFYQVEVTSATPPAAAQSAQSAQLLKAAPSGNLHKAEQLSMPQLSPSACSCDFHSSN